MQTICKLIAFAALAIIGCTERSKAAVTYNASFDYEGSEYIDLAPFPQKPLQIRATINVGTDPFNFNVTSGRYTFLRSGENIDVSDDTGLNIFGVLDNNIFTGSTLASIVFGSGDDLLFNGAPYGSNIFTTSFTFAVAQAPLPGSAPMFGCAIVALGAIGYRLKRRAAVGSA